MFLFLSSFYWLPDNESLLFAIIDTSEMWCFDAPIFGAASPIFVHHFFEPNNLTFVLNKHLSNNIW